jgi:DNA polymerase
METGKKAKEKLMTRGRGQGLRPFSLWREQMKTICLDIETFSSADLRKTGVYRYVEEADFEILLLSYAIDGGEIKTIDLAQGERVPEKIICAFLSDDVIKWAFNAQFERVCISEWLKRQGYVLEKPLPFGHAPEYLHYLSPKSWYCDMAWSAYLGLPLSLEGVGEVLGLDKQKLKTGKDLIRYFSLPCKATQANGGRARNLPSHDPEKWELYKSYNKRDVETELLIHDKLSRFPMPDKEWEIYHRDQEINDLGILLDKDLAQNAIRINEAVREESMDKLKQITGLENPNSVLQLKEWLASKGIVTESLDKKAVSELLRDATGEVKEVLETRQGLSKSSVKKYEAMRDCVCSDGRARGLFQFYGANRTGRFSGRLIQVQNLPRNKMEDLKLARKLVKEDDLASLDLLFDSIPQVLSELIRTAFIPKKGRIFLVADYSAIEARVLAWLAGETWRTALFSEGGDIYCRSASEMFGVPVEKHGVNAHLRQKGKIAELACIAEGELVLTDEGLVPIEKVTTKQKVWDGEDWVTHDGIVYRGFKEVMNYDGLRATPDHLVWIKGQSKPIRFEESATRSAHLLQTGDGRRAIRVGQNYQPGETLEQKLESLLCANEMYGMRKHTVAKSLQSDIRQVKGMPILFTKASGSFMASKTLSSGKTTMHQPKRLKLQKLRSKKHLLALRFNHGSRNLDSSKCRECQKRLGVRSNRHKRSLRKRKYPICSSRCQSKQQTKCRVNSLGTKVLALCEKRYNQDVIKRYDSRRNHLKCRNSCSKKAEELALNRSKARVYDIRNAGRHHRFTVSGKLVHNCGYGGSVGALKAMGALEMGLSEEELPNLVSAWRATNPNIVMLWQDVDWAAMATVRERSRKKEVENIGFRYESGMLIITLPSGRELFYARPRIEENRFGGESITYEGVGTGKRWERIETYGAKLVENIVQAISRDILCSALMTFNYSDIVMHVHDEIVIEADPRMSIQAVCEQMSRTPIWAEGLKLDADGFTCSFYRKD